VAQLPHEVREKLNEMLLDGLPYARIIENLGDAAKGLKEAHIGEWKPIGYQRWLDDRERRGDVRASRESALALVKEKAGATVQDASRTVASVQLHELLLSFNPAAFSSALAQKPELYLKLVHAIARMSEREAYCSKARATGSLVEGRLQPSESADGKTVISPQELQEITRLIKLL
jgi:hypothetical protein